VQTPDFRWKLLAELWSKCLSKLMPTVLRVGPYRFSFWANEGTEPPHVHVFAAAQMAKYWLAPISIAKNRGFRSGELSEIEDIIADHREFLLEKWYGFRNQ
jgi:hypothetical protein